MPQVFNFKQFSISQDQCAMKVGTDGVLLGSWVSSPSTPKRVLDIGTGTGLISLMLAQRFSSSIIDAIEIDAASSRQATNNFLNSPWSNRLSCTCESFQNYASKKKHCYSLIVSNPPFFANGQKTNSQQRNQARFEQALPFDDLLKGVSILLSPEGVFCVIIPFDQEEIFLSIAQKYELSLSKITRTKGNKNAPIKRSLLQLSFQNKKDILQEDMMILEKERHVYTDQYKEMVKDFYLKL